MLLDGKFSNTYGFKKSSSNASIHSVQDFETEPPNFTSSDSEDTSFLDFNLPDTDDAKSLDFSSSDTDSDYDSGSKSDADDLIRMPYRHTRKRIPGVVVAILLSKKSVFRKSQ